AGAIEGVVTVYGTNSPGHAIGTISSADAFTLKSGSQSLIEIATNTTAGSGWDLLSVDGNGLTLGGSLQVVLTTSYTPTNTSSFVVMTNATSSVSGAFENSGGRVRVYREGEVDVVGSLKIGINSSYVWLDDFRYGDFQYGVVILLR
ncbi:MAG: hypothetical protein HQ559_09820, partial [Lentisphaerae bacterium]|nr:hypothetical protein [Lentisphaerota bacterium]